MARLIKAFYKEHIAITSDMTQRPQVELIIAPLWNLQRDVGDEENSPVAVRIGGTYAQSLAGDLSR
jgi:hypothetical protein